MSWFRLGVNRQHRGLESVVTWLKTSVAQVGGLKLVVTWLTSLLWLQLDKLESGVMWLKSEILGLW